MYTDLEEPPRKPRQIRNTPFFHYRTLYAALFTFTCCLIFVPIHYGMRYKYDKLIEQGFLDLDDPTVTRRYLMRTMLVPPTLPELLHLPPEEQPRLQEPASV